MMADAIANGISATRMAPRRLKWRLWWAQPTLCAFALLITFCAAGRAHAFGADFSPKEIAACGRHCIHGYWVNESTTTFYAGDAAAINAQLADFIKNSLFPIKHKSLRVVIHANSGEAASPWDQKPRNMPADWKIANWLDHDDTTGKFPPGHHCQIDVWLGGRIKLGKLKIPDEFEVVSGGEIEKFIEARKPKAKSGAKP